MAEEKKAVPEAVTCDTATIKMLHIAQEKGQETIFDRAVKMKTFGFQLHAAPVKDGFAE